jgi:hypothetical protein
MQQIKNLGDRRQTETCLYCGGSTETREHAPSRIFVDEPYPSNMPTVYACRKCNNSYSLDEEYVACLIECARAGGVGKEHIEREKVLRILNEKPKLLARLKSALKSTKEGTSFTIEVDRVKRVLLKLAQCHILYEQNEPRREEPVRFEFGTFDQMSTESKDYFEVMPKIGLLPEVGSRAMQRLFVSESNVGMPWTEVQEDRYRYVTPTVGLVRMVFSEYLWCEIAWE